MSIDKNTNRIFEALQKAGADVHKMPADPGPLVVKTKIGEVEVHIIDMDKALDSMLKEEKP